MVEVAGAVLGLLYGHPDERYYLRRVAVLSGLGVGHAQRELGRLAAAGILRREERDRHVYFQANAACPIFEELRGIVAKTLGAVGTLRQALVPLRDRIGVAFVFGSVARGQENAASDLDVMVIGPATFYEVSAAMTVAEKTLLRAINLTVYTVAEFSAKIRAGNHFLNAVAAGEKLFVLGDEHELAALSAKRMDSAAPEARGRRSPIC